jgi:hypothetical protein
MLVEEVAVGTCLDRGIAVVVRHMDVEAVLVDNCLGRDIAVVDSNSSCRRGIERDCKGLKAKVTRCKVWK